MKNMKFITGAICGLITGLVLFMVISFRSDPAVFPAQSSGKITNLNSRTEVFRLNVDNVQYIVVVSVDGGTSIVRHR